MGPTDPSVSSVHLLQHMRWGAGFMVSKEAAADQNPIVLTVVLTLSCCSSKIRDREKIYFAAEPATLVQRPVFE